MDKRQFLLGFGAACASLVGLAGEADARRPQRPVTPERCVQRARRKMRGEVLGRQGGTSLAQENAMVDSWGMHRFDDLDDIQWAVADGYLVPVTDTESYMLDVSFAQYDPANRAIYAHTRPHVLAFLNVVLADFFALHRDELKNPDGSQDRFRINSLTRTLQYQRRIKRSKRDGKYAAIGTTPENRSTHLAGTTVDIGTGNLPIPVREDFRFLMAELEREDLILARAEGQGCMHACVKPGFTRERYAAAISRIRQRADALLQDCAIRAAGLTKQG